MPPLLEGWASFCFQTQRQVWRLSGCGLKAVQVKTDVTASQHVSCLEPFLKPRRPVCFVNFRLFMSTATSSAKATKWKMCFKKQKNKLLGS